MRRSRHLTFSSFLLACALMFSSCAASAQSGRRRPVPHPPQQQGEAQWQHDWVHGAVFYEIFVRSFADSNGDGIGDLQGLIERLDYLNDGNPATTEDLGVDALWLMPVFVSPSYHGYDTVDYEHINPQYGTDEDFTRLCDEAHRRGIRVIVDLVVNHSGRGHPWFVDSASSTTSLRRDWYVWSEVDRGWKQPWGGNNGTWHSLNGAYYYGVFWSGMPDLNFRTAAVREEIKRLATLWLQRGADGYRLDATRYLIETGDGAGQSDTVETHQFLKEFAAHVRQTKPQAAIVGENWTETPIIARYYGSTETIHGGDELPMNFNFPLSNEIVNGINGGNASGIVAKIGEVKTLYPAGVIDAPFLTNHDNVRLATQLNNQSGRLKNAAAVLLTMPGAPFLYYGEEVGLQNGPTTGDESKRTPMPWNATAGGGFTTGSPWFPFAPGLATANVAVQTADPGSLLSRYRTLIAVRKTSDALKSGEIELLSAPSSTIPILAFLRTTPAERVLVIHNVTDGFVSGGPYAFSASGLDRLYADSFVTDPSGTSGRWTVNLPPRASGIWRLR